MPGEKRYEPGNEKELLLRIVEGDEEAFADLYAHYYGQLRPYLWKFADSKRDAEEMLQETFIRVWLSRDKLSGIEHFQAWLYKVASREALSYLRIKLREREGVRQVAENNMPERTGVTPAEIFDITQITGLIRKAINLMPDQRRKIFSMSRDEGLKVGEIAEKLDISVSTVKNTITSAQKQIREHLIQSGYYLPLLIYTTLKLI